MQYIDRFTIPTWAIAAIENGDFSHYPDIGGLASEVVDADFYHA